MASLFRTSPLFPTTRRRRCAGGLLGLALALHGCTSVVELDLPPPEPQLVVNGVANPDSLFAVDLSASQSVFSNQPAQPVGDAVVQIFQAGQYVEALRPVRPGYYRGTRRPQPLQQYELRVNAPGLPSVSATTEVPTRPVTREPRASVLPATGGALATVEASFVLVDEPAQADFYYLQAYTPEIDRFNNSRTYNGTVLIDFAAPFSEEFTMGDRYFFSDRLFNEQSVKLTLRLDNRPTKVTYLRVVHISATYYNYVRDLVRQSYADNSITNAAPVANNIRNGLGLFGSSATHTISIKP